MKTARYVLFALALTTAAAPACDKKTPAATAPATPSLSFGKEFEMAGKSGKKYKMTALRAGKVKADAYDAGKDNTLVFVVFSVKAKPEELEAMSKDMDPSKKSKAIDADKKEYKELDPATNPSPQLTAIAMELTKMNPDSVEFPSFYVVPTAKIGGLSVVEEGTGSLSLGTLAEWAPTAPAIPAIPDVMGMVQIPDVMGMMGMLDGLGAMIPDVQGAINAANAALEAGMAAANTDEDDKEDAGAGD